ncbi:MAG: ATP-binding protein [Vulcanimicrobiota bacterium]
MFNRFLDQSVRRRGVDYRRRSRILLDTSLAIMAFNAVAVFALFGPLDLPQLAWAALTIFLVGTAVLPCLRLTGSVTIAGNILLAQIWALLHVLTLYTGKIQGVPPAWIVFLPILAIHICDKSSSIVWTVLATIEIFTVAWMAAVTGQMVGGALLLYLAIHLGLLTLMVSTAFLNDRFKAKTLARLSRANKELSKARDLALEASRAKTDFVANMSHELRTPLNVVIGYSEMLSEDAGAVGPEQLRDDLQRIKDSGQHLLRLINELLEFSRLEAGKLSLSREPIRVDILIRELVQAMEKEAEKNGNTLRFEASPGQTEEMVLLTDPTKYRQCLYNLLSNACKFTHEGEIEVRMRHSLTENERGAAVVVEVSDNGIGMTEEQLQKVFEPFVQAEASIARRYGGTGLGLSMSRRLAEGLGGTLFGFSEEGKGSRFVLSVPDLSVEPSDTEDLDPVETGELAG